MHYSKHWFFRLLLFGVLSGLLTSESWVLVEQAAALRIEKRDCIVFIGNTFVERMHLFGFFETILHSKFPDHQLKIRNMGWSADELSLKPRPEGFGDRHRYLQQEQADLIFVCFGMNEAFQGRKRLEKFEHDLDSLIEDLLAHQYNGRSAPQIVLVSPIAHENLGGLLPDGNEHNKHLQQYTEVLAKAAQRRELPFVDLFSPTRNLMSRAPEKKLTDNGIHLSAFGYWTVSQIMARSLGLADTILPPRSAGSPTAEKLRRAVYDKNYSFFFHWRPPNMEYIHGVRRDMPGAERLPEEQVQLYDIIGQLDQIIWQMEKPKPEQVWQQLPPTTPVWARTPEYQGITIPEIGDVRLTRRQEDIPRIIFTPAQGFKALEGPEGFEVNLYASEQEFSLANPMALNFDAKGRLWVANTPTWPHPFPGKQPQDSIVILEDRDHDGVADKETVFIDKLNMIHGFALGHGGAYIAQTPHLIFAKDTDGDDQADQFQMLLHGFGGEDVEHSINNFKWGPDGSLYFMEGTFFHTQVETPYGPERSKYGGVFRYNPRRQQFEVFVTYRLANPWGQVFDRWGQSIIVDASGSHFYNMDVLSAEAVYFSNRNNAETFFSLGAAGGGMDRVCSRQFPDDVQGRLLSSHICGNFRGMIWWDLKEDGTAYKMERVTPELVVSNDPHMGPLAMTVGPDGALYLVDFYTPLAENTSQPKRFKGRDHKHGRIWRIVYKKRPLLTPPDIVGEPSSVLLDLLKTYENSTRHLARRELQEREPQEVIPHLEQWVAQLDPEDPQHELHLLEALWVYQGLEVVEPQLLKRLLKAKDYRIRASTTRVLRSWQDRIDDSIDLLSQLVEDENVRVRMHAVLALGSSNSEQALNIALRATKHPMDPGMTKVLEDTLDYFERVGAGE